MSRPSLRFLAALASTIALSALSTQAQVKLAALDLGASSSSSSSSDMVAAPASDSIVYNSPVQPAPHGSTRPFSSVGVGAKIGTGGIGFDVATPLVPGILNLRGGAGFFSYTYNGNVDNEPVNAKLKLDNAAVMVDVFPFKGSFRLSAGTTVHNERGFNGSVVVAPGSQITIGNDTYTSSNSDPLTGSLSASFGGKVVPRLTLGWGNLVSQHHHLSIETEFGVDVTGSPTAVWNYGGSACIDTSNCPTGTPINSIPGATASISAQTADFMNNVNGVKVFPVLSFGMSYKIGKISKAVR